MNRGIRWFLGIVLGLVVVAILVGAGFFVYDRLHNGGWMMSSRGDGFRQFGRVFPWSNVPGQGNPRTLRPFVEVPASRVIGFNPLRMVFICLFGLGVLVLIVLGVVFLVSSLTRPKQAAATATPAASPVTPPPPSAEHACPHCGRSVQGDWSHCPYCGSPLTS